MDETGRRDEFEPAMVISLGSLVGMVCGLLVGLTLVDDVGWALATGIAIGGLVGTVVYLAYALVVGDDDV